MTIIRPGVYRVNVAPGTTELFVHKGRMALSDGKDDYVKGGKKVIFSGGGPEIAKLTDNDTDQFDDWSKDRGKTLALANARLSGRMVNGYLTASSWNAGSSAWGYWTWSPFSSCYTFLPFRNGWGSPYGASYGNYAFTNNSYGNHNNPYNPPVTPTNGSSGSSGSGYPSGGSSGSGGSGSSGMGSSGGYGGGGSSGGRSSTPTVSAPTQAGPRDPDSGGRVINTIKNPIN